MIVDSDDIAALVRIIEKLGKGLPEAEKDALWRLWCRHSRQGQTAAARGMALERPATWCTASPSRSVEVVTDVLNGTRVRVATLHRELHGVRVELHLVGDDVTGRARNAIILGQQDLAKHDHFDRLPDHFGPHWLLGDVDS